MPSRLVTTDGIPHLPVPGYTQPDTEPECLLYAARMVVAYIREDYRSGAYHSEVPDITVRMMKDCLTIREAGWTANEDELAEFSDLTDPLRWNLYYSGSPVSGNILHQQVQSALSRGFPTILVVDSSKLRRGVRAGGHAVVITGLSNDRVVINNPWGDMSEVLDWAHLANAWAPGWRTITTHLAGGPDTDYESEGDQ